MTSAHFDLVQRSLAAERAGDAEQALRLHSSVPALDLRSRHHLLLSQLVALGKDLPEWVWARWIAYQAIRCEDASSHAGQVQRRALKYAIETFHHDQLADCHADGGDPIKVVACVASESWLFHQLLLHELEGLPRFIDEMVTDRLADHSELARSWTGTRLGGFQIGASLPGGRLAVHDPAAQTAYEILDLGARACVADTGWVLGRLVPSGVDDLLMFDMPPLAVPEQVSRAMASSAEPWKCVKDALDEGSLVEHTCMRADYELVTDVPSIELLRLGTAPDQLERVTRQLRSGRDEIPRAALRILRRAFDDASPPPDTAVLGAAVIQALTSADARKRLVREGAYDAWARWASLVHEPARGLLLGLVEDSRLAG